MAVTKLHPEHELICSRWEKTQGYKNLYKEWIYSKNGNLIIHLCPSLGLPYRKMNCDKCGKAIPFPILLLKTDYVT